MDHRDLFGAAGAARTLRSIGERGPLVLSLTNAVVTNLTANVLLAVGASPVMLEDQGEAAELAAEADALVINLGTVSPASASAMERAAIAARDAGTPWVLDPVGVGVLAFRTELARRLVALRPAAIKGNASEIAALAGEGGGGKGVDSTAAPADVLKAARRLARDSHAVVAVTGPVDLITDGARVIEVRNGHPLMSRITGMGCSAAALAGACLAIAGVGGEARLAAVAHALALLGLAAERAVKRGVNGPASLQVGLIDALHAMDEPALLGEARLAPNGRLAFDPTLYLVADASAVGDRPLAEVVAAAVAGGVTAVQLRDKGDDIRAFVERAQELREGLASLGVPLIVNDRVDVALAIGAEGVHLGQSDLHPEDARRILGESAVIGLSITKEGEAHDVNPAVVDYLGVGPVFPTATKPDVAEPLGPSGLAAVRALVPTVPIVAIGGLHAGNVRRLLSATPVEGIAVVSAICGAPNPRNTACELRTLLENEERG